ncbi:uncharacterized protein PITG_00793 [Phytophthora infestans T30-4]|uniref:Uncharacterized protein n=1 Tax=Phytophthora infestans (strain T30-4) TaxID=403677 RepID=D0MRQ1_PHYIT|nr:uncharacterized protein PITG_00793 [Phytophthora infestans T30-4]EEY58170.1 hypothetical protein PITG_00793 [Phytophthora infestans T30-4]|eukprot:XP_002909356.1 hypothetical protein PITG_00793 [Phytophthora infestans T30-4]
MSSPLWSSLQRLTCTSYAVEKEERWPPLLDGLDENEPAAVEQVLLPRVLYSTNQTTEKTKESEAAATNAETAGILVPATSDSSLSLPSPKVALPNPPEYHPLAKARNIAAADVMYDSSIRWEVFKLPDERARDEIEDTSNVAEAATTRNTGFLAVWGAGLADGLDGSCTTNEQSRHNQEVYQATCRSMEGLRSYPLQPGVYVVGVTDDRRLEHCFVLRVYETIRERQIFDQCMYRDFMIVPKKKMNLATRSGYLGCAFTLPKMRYMRHQIRCY